MSHTELEVIPTEVATESTTSPELFLNGLEACAEYVFEQAHQGEPFGKYVPHIDRTTGQIEFFEGKRGTGTSRSISILCDNEATDSIVELTSYHEKFNPWGGFTSTEYALTLGVGISMFSKIVDHRANKPEHFSGNASDMEPETIQEFDSMLKTLVKLAGTPYSSESNNQPESRGNRVGRLLGKLRRAA